MNSLRASVNDNFSKVDIFRISLSSVNLDAAVIGKVLTCTAGTELVIQTVFVTVTRLATSTTSFSLCTIGWSAHISGNKNIFGDS